MLWKYADLKFLYRIQKGPNADPIQSIIDPVTESKQVQTLTSSNP